jgi:hypothetical protein
MKRMATKIRAYRCVLLAFAIALVGNSADIAHADNVPAQGSADYLHFSLDMTKIRINLVNGAFPTAKFPDLVVPKAYVIFVDSAPPSSQGPLPPLLKSDNIELMFVDGSGEAWTVAVSERARRDGIDRNTAGHRMRAEQTNVQIKTSMHADFGEFARANVTRAAPNRQDESFEGLAHYRGVASYSHYIGQSDDEFFSAQCEARLNPVFLCTYTMSITSGVVAYVHFVDFRLYGGRSYANRRLRLVREVVCRYLAHC